MDHNRFSGLLVWMRASLCFMCYVNQFDETASCVSCSHDPWASKLTDIMSHHMFRRAGQGSLGHERRKKAEGAATNVSQRQREASTTAAPLQPSETDEVKCEVLSSFIQISLAGCGRHRKPRATADKSWLSGGCLSG